MEATILGCRVEYDWKPADEGRPVLLALHGWGCDRSVFTFVEKAFGGSVSYLTLDFPGHGHSGEPPRAWGVPEYADMVLTLLDQLAIEKVQIAAHSFGGRVALTLAAKHPERVDKLVLTGGAGIRKPPSEAQLKRQRRFKRLNALLSALKRVAPFRALAEKAQGALRQKYGSPDYVKLDEVMRQTFSKVVAEDLTPLLEKVQAPTLLIWGEKDTETPLWMGKTMEQKIPDAALIVFDGRSHFAFVEESSRFLLIIREFFLGGSNA